MTEIEKDPKRVAERFPRIACAALTRREYFNRVWVRQEITFAKKAVVLCGKKFVNVEIFHAAVLFYNMMTVWEITECRMGRRQILSPSSTEEPKAAKDLIELIKTAHASANMNDL